MATLKCILYTVVQTLINKNIRWGSDAVIRANSNLFSFLKLQ